MLSISKGILSEVSNMCFGFSAIQETVPLQKILNTVVLSNMNSDGMQQDMCDRWVVIGAPHVVT
jgi:hypothetical protein